MELSDSVADSEELLQALLLGLALTEGEEDMLSDTEPVPQLLPEELPLTVLDAEKQELPEPEELREGASEAEALTVLLPD